MSKYTPSKNRTGGFDFQAITWVRDTVRGISRDERLLLQYLASRCNTNHECWPKQSLIAADLECSQRHVWGLLKSLTEKGLIDGKRRRNSSTIYTLQIQDSQTGAKPELANSCETGLANLCIISNHSEVTKQREVEVPTERRTPSATAGGKDWKTETQVRREKLDQIRKDYGKQWRNSRKARLSVFMQLGRLHFPDNPYFQQGQKLRPDYLNILDRIFEVLGRFSADVLDYTFKNWPTDGARKTPTLVALDALSWHEVYRHWKEATDYETKKAMLKRVSAKLQAIESAQVTA